jgi:hypothetical protein
MGHSPISGVILCGPGQPTEGDLTAVREFVEFLKTIKEKEKTMASRTPQESTTEEESWETVDEGVQPTTITLDTVGDVFIGIKLRSKTITDPTKGDTWTQFQFTGQSPVEVSGELCAINASVRLAESLSDVPDGALTRIEFTDTHPIKGQKDPMKLYSVKYRA